MEARFRVPIWVVLLGAGLLMRWLFFERSFFFAHDQDLYSWIAKDIIVNGHQRLVGQITSVDGVFIGSFYYYVMAIFYRLFGMNPLSAIVPITLISIFNIVSIYWVIKRNWGMRAGLIAAAIYAFSFGIARFDRWSVPTLPTLTWSIWFWGVIMELGKGNLKWLPIYGFLVGFIWQLHIALLPIVPLPILAFFVGKNKFSSLFDKNISRYVWGGILIFLITISPFFVFELKHNWSQVRSMAASTQKDIGAPTGKMKLIKVIEASGREIQQRIVFDLKYSNNYVYWLMFIAICGYLTWKKHIKWQEVGLMWGWIGLIMVAQFVSKRVVSEYYFTNTVPIVIAVMAIFLAKVITKNAAILVIFLYLVINSYWLVTKTDEDQSYLYRRQVVEYIKADKEKNNYNCIAVNFIADPGVGVGFRYLFWYYGVDIVKPGSPGVPVYNIPIPWQLSRYEKPVSFGRFGVLKPVAGDYKATEADCKNTSAQLDPLLGYTE
ncbi:glycosyltransferase family 39 protein [Candidatus Shapirobacteria bacterium]|nr:glycosyltransferase family 39 protein [Candidatus Shapirobacteria bacterium]